MEFIMAYTLEPSLVNFFIYKNDKEFIKCNEYDAWRTLMYAHHPCLRSLLDDQLQNNYNVYYRAFERPAPVSSEEILNNLILFAVSHDIKYIENIKNVSSSDVELKCYVDELLHNIHELYATNYQCRSLHKFKFMEFYNSLS